MRRAALQNPAIRAVWVEALFASPAQPSDHPTDTDIAAAVRVTLRRLGRQGVLGVVATEFGDHPDAAVIRMTWCRRCLADITAARNTAHDTLHDTTADRAVDGPVSPHVERCPR